jgi:hypothetical protein
LREAGFRTKLKKNIAKSKNNFGRVKKVITFATPIEKSGRQKRKKYIGQRAYRKDKKSSLKE